MPRSRTVDLRWIAILNDFRRSGLTHADFCRVREIPLHSFRKHLYHARTPKTAPAASDARPSAGANRRFLPVTILPDPTLSIPASQSHLELILPNGRRIAIAAGFDTQTLRRLIAVVEEQCASGQPQPAYRGQPVGGFRRTTNQKEPCGAAVSPIFRCLVPTQRPRARNPLPDSP
jgi:hypothetical protein